MSNFEIRTFTPQDIPQIMELQQAYQKAHPDAAVIPGEVYLSSGFGDGENIFCAYDEEGRLQGYAPLLPYLAVEPQTPHTVWAEVKVRPELASPREIKGPLFERVVHRAGEIARAHPGHETHLTFEYHASETASIEYVMSQGCAYTESAFRMVRDLSKSLPLIPAPEKIEVRHWRMESEAEQQAYVQARNEAFPGARVALAHWQHFLSSPAWQEGGNAITAFDGEEIAGSVAAYWDEAISQQIGKRIGITEYIFVRANWRRRGIAAYLISQALLYLKEHDREIATLEVSAVNQNALELYRGLGYEVVQETRMYVLKL